MMSEVFWLDVTTISLMDIIHQIEKNKPMLNMEDSKEIIEKWLHLTKDGQSRIDVLFSMKMNEHFPFTSEDFKGIEESSTDRYGIGKALNEYFIEKDYPFKAFAGYDIDTARKLIKECEKYRDGSGEGKYPAIKMEYFLGIFDVRKPIPEDLLNWLYWLPEKGLSCREVKDKEDKEGVELLVVQDKPENKKESETRATEDVTSNPHKAYIKRTGDHYCYSHMKTLYTESDFKKHRECRPKIFISKIERKISPDMIFKEDRATIEKQKQKIRDEIKAKRDY